MNTLSLKPLSVACALVFAAALPLAAQADVKVETLTHIEDVTGLSNHDSDTTDYFQGTKKREENQRKFTGSVLGAWQKFKGEDKGAMDIDIYDVSANKHWDLDPQKKVYNVDAIYDPSRSDKAPPAGGRNQQQKPEQDKDQKVTKNEFTVKDTGQSKNINGFDAHEYLITWDYETQNTKTGETAKNLMTTDTWTSTDGKLVKARDAETTYEKAYFKLMQMQAPASDDTNAFGLDSNAHIEINGEEMKSAVAKLRTIKGLPVFTDIRWEASGTDSDGKPSNDADAGKDSGKTLDSALGSLFGHKSDDSDKGKDQKSQGVPATAGMTTLFSSHMEVKAVDTSAVGAAQFQVPADYKLDD
ncbi:MAG TPA: hypothetical protein VGM16_02935 [Gammaproteobacteria bacterium]|jgi:hypothetical protein